MDYYDSLCLLNNLEFLNFDRLFSKLRDLVADTTKRAIVIKTLLGGIRGISTKTLMVLLFEDIFRGRGLDYAELIFVDLHAVRVARNMQFPYYEDDLVGAIRKFGETYKLNANGKNLELMVKRQNGKLNVYKRCIFNDFCPNAKF